MEPYKSKKWLKERYVNESRSTCQIAAMCAVSQATVLNWLIKFGIPRRTISEALHIVQASHCNITPELVEVINGQLLSDACLYAHSQYSATLSWSQKHKEYTEYIKNILSLLEIATGEIRQQKVYLQETGKKYDQYVLRSRSYAELLLIKEKWYLHKNGKNYKRVPENTKLTATTCLHWYLGDGTLYSTKKGRSVVILSTNSFLIEDVKLLINKLHNLGFKATRQPSSNAIYLSTKSVIDFLDYIGPSPVTCYEYKWNYQDNRKIQERTSYVCK